MTPASVAVGDTFHSRTGRQYTVTEVRSDGGFSIARDGGKPARISGRMVARTLARLEAGERFAYQKNATQGGISYTVAIESGVVYALRNHLTRDDAARCFIRR
jgi:hypothetical protein